MTAPSELKPVGYQLWFALGALVLGTLLYQTTISALPFVLIVLAIIWGVVGSRRPSGFTGTSPGADVTKRALTSSDNVGPPG